MLIVDFWEMLNLKSTPKMGDYVDTINAFHSYSKQFIVFYVMFFESP